MRYCQRRDLRATPARAAGGFRHFAPETVQRIPFIKRAQALGFTLDEIAALLALNDGANCAATRRLAETKLVEIETRIADFQAVRESLRNLIAECRNKDARRCCPIIDALAREDE